MMKILLMVFILITGLFGFGCKTENKPAVSSAPVDVKPIFNAVSLVGKSPKEVEEILGSPTNSFTTPKGRLKQVYEPGETVGVEFYENRIESLLITFRERNIDTQTAYRLVGLDYTKPKPAGISDIQKGETTIFIYY